MSDREDAEAILRSLSDAQIDVMERVVMHLTSKEIARDLGIAPNTVDQRVKAVLPKLGAIDRADAARRFVELYDICGRTIYASSVIDHVATLPHSLGQELPQEAHFVLKDSQAGFPAEFQYPGTALLEVIDLRFGKIGRVALIIGLSIALAILALIVTSIGATLSDLVR